MDTVLQTDTQLLLQLKQTLLDTELNSVTNPHQKSKTKSVYITQKDGIMRSH